MSNLEFTLVANPISGKGRAVQVAKKAFKRLTENHHKGEIKFTTHAGSAYELAKIAIENGRKWLIVCGGDGTIHEVVNAIAGNPEIALGLLPCGKGNDLANALAIPKHPDRAIDILLCNNTKKVDLGSVGDKFFDTIITCGLDAEISRRVTEEGTPFSGTAAYVYTAITTLSSYEPPHAKIEGDFGTYEGKILIASTGITSSYGGGMKIVPEAELDDGLFDICIIEPVANLTVLRMLATLFWGGHTKHPAVHIHRTKSLKIETDPPVNLHADGEFVTKTPATIEIIKHGLKVVCDW